MVSGQTASVWGHGNSTGQPRADVVCGTFKQGRRIMLEPLYVTYDAHESVFRHAIGEDWSEVSLEAGDSMDKARTKRGQGA